MTALDYAGTIIILMIMKLLAFVGTNWHGKTSQINVKPMGSSWSCGYTNHIDDHKIMGLSLSRTGRRELDYLRVLLVFSHTYYSLTLLAQVFKSPLIGILKSEKVKIVKNGQRKNWPSFSNVTSRTLCLSRATKVRVRLNPLPLIKSRVSTFKIIRDIINDTLYFLLFCVLNVRRNIKGFVCFKIFRHLHPLSNFSSFLLICSSSFRKCIITYSYSNLLNINYATLKHLLLI